MAEQQKPQEEEKKEMQELKKEGKKPEAQKAEEQKTGSKEKTEVIIIDGKNAVLGRMAAFAAKQALIGKKVAVINCEDIIIIGKPSSILAHYKEKVARGHPLTGPHFPRASDRIVRRTIRGMLPYKKSRGMDAFRRVMCYSGIPAEYASKKSMNLGKNVLSTTRYITLAKLCRHL